MDESVLKKGKQLLNEKEDVEERLRKLSLKGCVDYYLVMGNVSIRLGQQEMSAIRNLLIKHYEDCLDNVKKEMDAL